MDKEQILELADRLDTVRKGMEAGLDDWPTASQIWEYQQASKALRSLVVESDAAIESYKAEFLKEVGEPVAYMTTDEEGSASMLFFDRAEALKYSGDDEPVNLFAESQLAAAQEEWNQCSGLLDDSLRSIEMLEDQLATAEQRVAEYNELIYAVQTKNPDETRHQTALRYIRNAENRPSNTAANGASS